MDILLTAAADIARERLQNFIKETLLCLADDVALWGLFTSMLDHAQNYNFNSSFSNSIAYQKDRDIALYNLQQINIEKQRIEAEKQQEQRRNTRKY